MTIFRDVCQWGEANWANGGLICANEPIHRIGGGDDNGRIVKEFLLCHEHFVEALHKGLISDPFIGTEEYQRRGGKLP